MPIPLPDLDTATACISNPSLLTRLRLVVALVAMLAVVAVSSHNAVLHHPGMLQTIEDARHASLAAEAGEHGHVHDDDDGHVHDDGSDEEQKPGHVHGHNTADHSHVPMVSAVFPIAFGYAAGTAWESGPLQTINGGPSFPFERPPRPGIAV